MKSFEMPCSLVFYVIYGMIASSVAFAQPTPSTSSPSPPISATAPPSNTADGSILPSVLPDPFNRPVLDPFTNTTIGTSNETLLEAENSPFTASTLQFVTVSPEFDAILGPSPKLLTLAQKNYSFAHEGPVWLQSLNALFFVSNRLGNTSTSNQHVETWLVDADQGNLTQINPIPAVPMANGATLMGADQVLLLSQGANATGGALYSLDPGSFEATPLVNNWFGLAFNSPNDVVLHPDGTVFFTDPSYGHEQLFRTSPQLGTYVWRWRPESGPPQVAADGFIAPNGLCFSPDYSTLYISDTGFFNGSGAWDPSRPHSIYAYDVITQDDSNTNATTSTTSTTGDSVTTVPLQLANRRTFATSTTGIPDGIKVDMMGNVYTGVGDGVDVYSASGQLIGKITVGGVANLAFGGKNRSRLFMLQEKKVTAVDLNTQAPQLPQVVPGKGDQSWSGEQLPAVTSSGSASALVSGKGRRRRSVLVAVVCLIGALIFV